MKTTFLRLATIVALVIIANSSIIAQVNADAILGEWLSPKKDTRFLIYKKSERFYGKILWGSGGETKDVKNADPKLRSRELIGLTMLNDFVFDGEDTWKNGTIYDPREGKTYSCKINFKSKDELNVRGYLGVSMFGRTEVWTRTKNN